jgi:cysteinyl-tRNA synthetase
MAKLVQETLSSLRSSLDDDINTAQFQAAIFDMVRTANATLDAGQIHSGDAKGLLKALDTFDEIFAVIQDDDAAKMRTIVEWARADGREISPEAMDIVGSGQLSDADIEKKIGEMNAARTARNFAASDALRAELVAAGVLVENTKDGVRWRRK